MPNTIRALLFDLDDTLYSRSAAFRRWTQEFVRDDLGLAEDDPRYQEVVERIIDLDDCGYSSRDMLFSEIKEARDPILQESVEQLIATYNRRFLDHIREETGTQRLLKALKDAGLPFGIITNGVLPRQSNKIRVLGLDALTSCIFISQQFGCEKPDATIFLAAAACLGYEPGDILFIGDHPHKDIWGAQQVGMHTAWVQHQREWPAELAETQPDYSIGSLDELCSLLDITP